MQVIELLEIIQFRSPDTTAKLSNVVTSMKYDFLVRSLSLSREYELQLRFLFLTIFIMLFFVLGVRGCLHIF